MNRRKVKLVYGVGVNDATYNVTLKIEGKQSWVCPYYKSWRNMLHRCYSETYLKRQPTYRKCSVVDDWLTFSVFRGWMTEQDWAGNQLDKDLIGNGIEYSPDNCIFISSQLNKFIATDRTNGDMKTGVTFDKRSNKYCAQCVDPTNSFSKHVGTYDTEESAHLAYTVRKRIIANILADKIGDIRIATALRRLYA